MGADVAGARAAILLAERLRGAFDHLASREILADQLKAKDHRSGGGQLRENAELARFGAYWGFRIRA